MTKQRWLGYLLFFIWLVVTAYVGVKGWGYYQLPLAERPLDVDHRVLKPGGFWGHGLGVVGSVLMIVGVVMYMLRKRVRWMMTWGNLRTWLTVHIFLCVMGATLITFHTAFKVGGLVAISFWCMIGVVFSGVVGRYVYVRIPRDFRGHEATVSQLQVEYQKLCLRIQERIGQNHGAVALLGHMVPAHMVGLGGLFKADMTRFIHMRRVQTALREDKRLPEKHVNYVVKLAKRQVSIQRSIHFYSTLKKVLHYWHVIHLPFTVVMFLVMIIHVAVAILFGHRWIF